MRKYRITKKVTKYWVMNNSTLILHQSNYGKWYIFVNHSSTLITKWLSCWWRVRPYAILYVQDESKKVVISECSIAWYRLSKDKTVLWSIGIKWTLKEEEDEKDNEKITVMDKRLRWNVKRNAADWYSVV